MTNHVHSLVTPNTGDGVSKFMQSLGRHYVRFFNRQYKRTGTLWEGRFKSSIVQLEDYLFQCYRYIELNPGRARIVEHLREHTWSSFQINGIGKESELCSPPPEYLRLGKTKIDRLQAYNELFKVHLEPGILKAICESINSGLALGAERFKDEVEHTHEKRVRVGKSGRPRLEC